MQTNKNLVYKFKPFEFTDLLENKEVQFIGPNRSRYCVAATEAYLIAYAGNHRSNNELKKYSFDLREWKIITYQGIPRNLECPSIALFGNLIIIYSTTGYSVGNHNIHNVYIGNLANENKKREIQFEELKLFNDLIPNKFYIQFAVIENQYMISISFDLYDNNNTVVCQLDLNTRKLETLNAHEHLLDCPQNLILYKNTIYIFGMNLLRFHTFNLATKKWDILIANEDPVPSHSNNRKSYSCVQCTENLNLVYVSGGIDRGVLFNDIWRFDLNILHWEKFTQFTLPCSVFWHSTTVTPSGRFVCYGNFGILRFLEDRLISAWITVPKLKMMCWEAMLYYFKEQMFDSTTENLKKIGVPPEFCNRIIEAKEIKTSQNKN